MTPRIISRKIKYRGLWADIRRDTVRLPDGKTIIWESIITDDAIVLVPMDSEKNVYLAKEWRPAWERTIVSLPAGICFQKNEKGVLKQARNELREEIGFDAKKWEKLGSFFLGGRQKQIFHAFLARDLFRSEKKPDEGEIVEVVKMPFKQACNKFLSGKERTTSFTLAALALAKERLKL